MSKVYKDVRFSNLIDSEINWRKKNPLLAKGELAIVKNIQGKYMIVLGRDNDRVGTVLAEMEKDPQLHQDHVFFPGAAKGGGSGDIPIATEYVLGGVKIPTATTSGLMIGKDGTLTNNIISSYDYNKKCYVIDKIYIKNLETDRQSENTNFSGDSILLRDGATTPVDNFSGLRITNLREGINGGIGFTKNGKMAIIEGENIIECYPLRSGIKSGYPVIDEQSTCALLTAFKPLSIINGLTINDMGQEVDRVIKYYPDKALTAEEKRLLNITPPTIKVDHQPIPYNDADRSYDIELTSGFTEETWNAINSFQDNIDRITNLELKSIYKIQPDLKDTDNTINIKNIDANTVEISHKKYKVIEHNTNATYYVRTPDSSSTHETLTFLKDIDVDSHGHVINKTFVTVEWLP